MSNRPWLRHMPVLGLLLSFSVSIVPSAVSAASQSEVSNPALVLLPAPTGPHSVGKTMWHWPDPARPDTLTTEPGDTRELVVKAWYPTESSVAEGPANPEHLPLYAPLSRAYEHVRDAAVPGARFAALDAPAPVVILCPGRGAAAYSYSALAEDLASHGYAVFAFDAPHTGFVRYPDGRTVEPSDEFQVPRDMLFGPYEHVDAFHAKTERLGGEDFAMVVRRVAELDADDPSGRFTGRLDLSSMGAIGHSMGGRSCGAGVDADDRFKALALIDGVPPRQVRYKGLDQAVLSFLTSDIPEDLAMPNLRSMVPERRSDVYIVKLPNAGHNSLRDRPYLTADQGERAGPATQLAVIRALIRDFLDRYVRGADTDVSVGPDLARHARIETYPADTRRDR